MGQREVIEFLEKQRQTSDRWFDMKDIKSCLLEEKVSNSTIQKLAGTMFTLMIFDMIEMKGVGIWEHKKLFRGKKQVMI